MANRVKVTKRAFNAVKKVASTGASKSYICKVSGLSNMTVYRILRAKTYEEYRGKTAEVSQKDYSKRKSKRINWELEFGNLRADLDVLYSRQHSADYKILELNRRVNALESAKPKKHWWSR